MQKMKMWTAVIFVFLLLCGCGKSAGHEEVITPESLVQEIVSTETAEETVEKNTQETEETEEEETAEEEKAAEETEAGEATALTEAIESEESESAEAPIPQETADISEITVYKYATTSVRVRTAPSLESDIFKVLQRRDEVGVISDDGQWSKVLIDGFVYYVASEYLKEKTEGSREDL